MICRRWQNGGVGGTGKRGRGLLESLALKNNNTMEDFDHDYQQTQTEDDAGRRI
jgi:hypothetical protein